MSPVPGLFYVFLMIAFIFLVALNKSEGPSNQEHSSEVEWQAVFVINRGQ